MKPINFECEPPVGKWERTGRSFLFNYCFLSPSRIREGNILRVKFEQKKVAKKSGAFLKSKDEQEI